MTTDPHGDPAIPNIAPARSGTQAVRSRAMRMRMAAALGAAAVMALAGAACGAGAESTDEAAGKPATTPAATTPAAKGTTAAAQKCEVVPDALTAGVLSGAEATAGKLVPVRAAAWKSPDYAKVWFIAIRFKAEGVGEQVGVWASNSLEAGGGLILAVDGFAQQFTVWPNADKTDAKIGGADRGVAIAKSCLAG